MKKAHYFINGIFLLIIILTFTACRSTNVQKNVSNQNIIETTNITVKSDDIEKLSVSDGQILRKVYLNIIGLDDKGTFLGLGYGPNGDGYRKKAVYKFNFEGDLKEIIEKDVHTYANVNKENETGNTYYYFQENEDKSKVQLMKVNYNKFSDEKLAEFDYEDILLLTPSIFVNQQDLYYFNINDNCLYRRPFSDNAKVKLLDNVDEIENMLFYKDTTYILLSRKCVKVNLKSNLSENIFEGKMIGWGENQIYYLNKQNVICIYDISDSKTKVIGKLEQGISYDQCVLNEKKQKIYFTGTKDNKLTLYEYNMGSGKNIMRLQSENKEDVFSKPYFMGKWVAVISYPTSTIYYWNSDELDSIRRIQSIGISSIVEISSESDNGYLLYTYENEKKLGLLDMDHDKNYNINISSLISDTKHPISFWYYNENAIYGQDVCDWDLGEDNPDEFYKIKLKLLLN